MLRAYLWLSVQGSLLVVLGGPPGVPGIEIGVQGKCLNYLSGLRSCFDHPYCTSERQALEIGGGKVCVWGCGLCRVMEQLGGRAET